MITRDAVYTAIIENLETANEELTSAKEELQSVNEELVTVNSELENKIDELTRYMARLDSLGDRDWAAKAKNELSDLYSSIPDTNRQKQYLLAAVSDFVALGRNKMACETLGKLGVPVVEIDAEEQWELHASEVAARIDAEDRKLVQVGDKRYWYFTKTIRIADVDHPVRLVILWERKNGKDPVKMLITNRPIWEVEAFIRDHYNHGSGR